MPERILEFEGYTDDTAPGYGWSLTTAYTTVASVWPVLPTVLAVRLRPTGRGVPTDPPSFCPPDRYRA